MSVTKEQIESFLHKVDKLFPIPLSHKQNLSDFATKLKENGALCTKVENDELVALVAGYIDNVINKKGYISIVATLPRFQGKGYASELVKDFLNIAKEKCLEAVHLYAVPSNIIAINMYKQIGFVEWKLPDEPRPDDLHLVYYIRNEEKE